MHFYETTLKSSLGTLKEIWYYPATGKKFVRRDLTSEKMTLRGESKGPENVELIDNLTASDGILQAGCMPALEMGNEEGMKSMCEALAGSVTKTKAPKKPKEKTEELKPATSKERLRLRLY